ncbi:sensor domain-containing protein [Sporosarcina gallistercoris]|uniref:EAL domain-containing protein n=1 Tax=Sporosarcina gallistercoris TaxID=2762245 RepID=A0ABR8PHR4_9BACL|nr:EAL domain-containing protein [Sporosarcina gallistercoris]MBD7907614.1 EAL domain-containing protein [Sporosarcina gallistercoris]
MVLTEAQNIPSLTRLLDEKFCVSITDTNGIITYVNKHFCELTQYSTEELIGNTYQILSPGHDPQMVYDEMNRSDDEELIKQLIVKGFTKDSTPYWVQATVVPVVNEDQVTTHYISIDSDITEERLTSQKYDATLKELNNLESALDHSSVIAATDAAGVIKYVNSKFCELSKYSKEELLGKTHRLINSGHHPEAFFKNMWSTIRSGEVWRGEVKNRAKDGSFYWMNTTIVPFSDDSGTPYEYISIRTDITARIEAEQALEAALKNDFRTTVKNLQNAIFKYVADDNGRILITLLEGQICEKLGLSSTLLNTRGESNPFSQTELQQLRPYAYAALNGEPCQFELDYLDHSFIIYLSPICEDGTVIEVVGTCVEITDRKKAEKLVEHMAFYDALTGLPNRRLFKSEVNETITQAENGFSILYLDLDRFKNINDSLGHFIGDEVLKAVANRLSLCLGPNDLACRLAGDEFVLMIRETDPAKVKEISLRIIEEISNAYTFSSIEVYITPSIGISRFPMDGEDYDTLMRHADTALFLAKDQGKSTYCLFTQEMNNDMIEKTLLEMDLRQAISRNEMELHYQPQYDMKTGRMTGVEALARWNHSKKGLISPGQFIPIAEESGIILPIGLWILETACKQAKQWQEQGFPNIRMSVNVSIRQFKQPAFINNVLKVLQKTGLDPCYLNIEITESMTTDVDYSQKILQQLHNEGIHVSIDDFGTGYSSLSYLSKFPITHLKIDQVFLQDLSSSNTAIIKTIIDLAKNLSIDVIAEGVETDEQALFLSTLRCDEVQGFLYSRPLPKHEIEKLLQTVPV